MTTIVNGMASGDLITALNANFLEICGAGNYTEIDDTMDGTTIDTNFDANFQTSRDFVGMKGSTLLNILNTEFDPAYIHTPSGLILEWVDDYCQIDITDNTGGTAQHAIWESLNGADYSLVHTLDTGVETYNYATWQNANLNLKVRAKDGTVYSKYGIVENILTPIVFKTDQSILTDIHMDSLALTTGKSVVINWGDDTETSITTRLDDINKSYLATQNPYFITISGDTDFISQWEMLQQWEIVYGDVSKWIVPTKMDVWHFYQNGFTGDIGHFVLNSVHRVIHFAYNHFTGNIENWIFPSTLLDIHIDHNELTGDLSNILIPYFPPEISQHARFHNNQFTDSPRGNLIGIDGSLEMENNNMSSEAIDGMLAYIDSFFTGAVVPLKNQGFQFTGINMGIPSSAGLASKASIEAKYIAQEFTVNIGVNT